MTLVNDFRIMVEGDFACYTRPELKTERVSYDVPTPTAIQGLVKSVYWKPAVRYIVDEIIVFNPIRFFTIRRNEVKEKVSFQKMRAKMEGKGRDPSIYPSECIDQRYSMILQDVKYGIRFHLEMTGIQCDGENGDVQKHMQILDRRLSRGQYFRMPCLGCSEFPVKRMEYLNGQGFPYGEISQEIRDKPDVDLGFMVYSIDFSDGGVPVNNDWEHPVFKDTIAGTTFYRPHMEHGIIDVQKYRRDMPW